MLSLVVLAVLFITSTWLIRCFLAFQANKRVATQLGLPYVSSPVDPWYPLWIASQRRLLPLLRKLPFNLDSFTRYSTWGWQYKDHYKIHQELGDAFIHVNPFNNELFLADAGAVNQVFTRRKDFLKPVQRYGPLEVFGRHLASTEGTDWQRHKKNTAPSFNERSNHLVWQESIRQSRQMIDTWTEQSTRGQGFNSTVYDMIMLSANVIAAAVYGSTFNFHTYKDSEEDESIKIRNSLVTITQNFSLVVLVPEWLKSLSFMPDVLVTISAAKTRFRDFLNATIAKERDDYESGGSGNGTLAASMVRSSAENHGTSGAKTVSQSESCRGLSEDEIIGNLFLFNLAGQETTSSSLAYSTLLLSAHPEYQDWMAEEIRTVFPSGVDIIEYSLAFPQLKRVLAVMLETLRLFGPIGAIAKLTTNQVQTITLKDRTITIPPHTNVLANMCAMHTHPAHWGPNPLEWRPKRWITSPLSGSSSTTAEILNAETLLEPTKGTYFPWSEGARICPGKKFAQVEFVAVMSQLFRNNRVQVVPIGGEDQSETSARVWTAVNDFSMKVFLQMRDPRAISLKLVPTESGT